MDTQNADIYGLPYVRRSHRMTLKSLVLRRFDMRKGFRTPPKTLTVELAGFPRRSLMVPPLEAGSHEQPARVMPGRCDEPARTRCHYKLLDVPIMECFDEDRKALMFVFNVM